MFAFSKLFECFRFYFSLKSCIAADFRLVDIVFTVDVHYKLEKMLSGDAVFRINYKDITYQMTIIQNHNETEAKGLLTFASINRSGKGQWGTQVLAYPKKPEVQLIARHVGDINLNRLKTINSIQSLEISI